MEKNNNGSVKWLIPVIILALAAGGAGGAYGYDRYRKKTDPSPKELLESTIQDKNTNRNVLDVVAPVTVEFDAETLKELFSDASDLVSQKYYYSNVGELEKYRSLFDNKIPMTTDKQLFTYDGTICVGIDLSLIEYKQVDNENKVIKLKLPYPKIISHELDMGSFEYYDISNSVFTSITPQDATEKLDILKKWQELKMQDNADLYDKVISSSEDTLRNILVNSGASDYTIEFSVGEQSERLNAEDIRASEAEFADQSSGYMVRMPKSAEDYEGENYKDVVEKLKDMGFTETPETIGLGDIVTGIMGDKDEIASISINGIDNFEKNESFPIDATIRIKFHSKS